MSWFRCTAIAFITLPPLSGFAQDLGIQFSKIPKGLKAQYKVTGGREIVEIYKGKEGQFYVVDVRWGDGNPLKTSYYNLQGHLVRDSYANGNSRSYAPHHCERVVGECTHSYSNSLGTSGTAKSSIKPAGKGYRYVLTINGKRVKHTYSLGQYNLYAQVRSGNQSMTLVSLSR